MSAPLSPSPPGYLPTGRLAGCFLPPAAARILALVASTDLPVLCLDSSGPAFSRVAAAIHDESHRDRLVLVDLHGDRGGMLRGLIRANTSPRATLAIDGIDLLEPDAQVALVRTMERDAPRLISGSLAGPQELRAHLRPDVFALASTITVRTPALALRGTEIGELAASRLARLATALGRSVPRLARDAVAALAAHGWPGDFAELDALLARTLLAADVDLLEAQDLRWDPEDCNPEPRRAGDENARRAEPAERSRSAQSAAGSDSAWGGSGTVETDLAPDLSETIAVELAHQLKNPLVTVKTFVQNVGSLSASPSDLARFRDLTDEAIERMDEALEEMLSVARLGPPRPAAVEVVELLRDALRDPWASFARKEITVTGPDGASLNVVADPAHLRVAFAVLARHLLEAIEPRSALDIAVEPPRRILLAYRESGLATHLRGVTGLGRGSFPLALLLVRGALARAGGRVDITHERGRVRITLCFAAG